VVLDHLTETQRRAYVLADNRLGEIGGGWDAEMLKLEVEDLGEALDGLGFSAEELEDLGVEDEVQEGLADPDETPAQPEQPVSVLGDVWVMGKHRVMCGDSTSVDAVDRLMAGQKADMVFTDPPYGVDYKGINNDDRSGLESLLRGAFANYLSSSKSGAACYVFHSDKCADIFHAVFREFFHFSSMIIWAKNSLTLSRIDYQSQHEPCLYGWMKDGAHSFYGDRKQVSVWRFDKERVQGHTTPKPVALIERAIQNSSKGGDIVSDLFGGSGSTMIACEKTGRTARLMELDPKYCDVIVKRWQDFTGKEAVNEATGKTFDETKAKMLGTA
jgi:DNA modification methylase